MNKTFKLAFGAAALLAGGASSASAYTDYTWTLSEFVFGAVFETQDYKDNLDEATPVFGLSPDNGVLNGTMTLRNNNGVWSLQSANFTSGPSDSLLTSGPFPGTSYSLFGTNDINQDLLGYSDDFAYELVLTWGNNSYGALTANNLTIGTEVSLDDVFSAEMQVQAADPDNFPACGDIDNPVPGQNCEVLRTRTNGFYTVPSIAQLTEEWGQPGIMQLTRIQESQPVPEPATMALLGTGLLGLFAARRRRAA